MQKRNSYTRYTLRNTHLKNLDLPPFDPERTDYSALELEAYADILLREDSNMRPFDEAQPDSPPKILFQEHVDNRWVREVLNQYGVPDTEITKSQSRDGQTMYHRCVDFKTEALTQNGWKNIDQLLTGQKIWAYEPNTDSYQWETLVDVFKDESFSGYLHVLESQQISARITEGHKWIVASEWDKSKLKVVQSGSTLKDRHYIPLARKPSIISEGYSPLHELAGWILTDGSYYGTGGMKIYQALHNPKVGALKNCLEANYLSANYTSVDRNNVASWHIPESRAREIRSFAPIKTLSSTNMVDMTHGERESLLHGIVYGDGYTRQSKNTREVCTTKIEEADSIQALCSLLGITTSLRTVNNSNAFCPTTHVVYMKEKRGEWAYVRNARQEQEWYEGTIWCPVVSTGFWLARRNGKVFTTGNTHPEGRKVNSKTQRKRNGASYYR